MANPFHTDEDYAYEMRRQRRVDMEMGMIGLRIYPSPLIQPTPKLAFTTACGASAEVIAEVNAYLLETFGASESAYVIGGNAYVSPKTYAKIRNLT